MKKILFILLTLVLTSGGYAFSLTCDWKTSCGPDEESIVYAHNEFSSDDSPFSSGDVLSSPVSINLDGNFSRALCCSSPYGELNFSIANVGDSCSGSNTQEIMYLTSDTNSKLAVENESGFFLSNYTHKICLEKPETFETVDMIINETASDYEAFGYSCVYRTSSLINGLVSSCDATFDGGKQYEYTVYTRMFETQSSLQCNSDCTSNLDGRVYSSCGGQIQSCTGVPEQCDGSLYGAWVDFGNEGREVQCSAPWNNFRGGFSASDDLEISSVDNSCSNIITKDHTVMVNNELTTMKILICTD